MKRFIPLLLLLAPLSAGAAPDYVSSYASQHMGSWHIEPSGDLTCLAYTAAGPGNVNILVSDHLNPGGGQVIGHMVQVAVVNSEWKSINKLFGDPAMVSFYFPGGDGPDGVGEFQEVRLNTAGSPGWGYVSTLGLISKDLGPDSLKEMDDAGQGFLGGIIEGAPVQVGMGTQIITGINFATWKEVGPEFEKCLRSWSPAPKK